MKIKVADPGWSSLFSLSAVLSRCVLDCSLQNAGISNGRMCVKSSSNLPIDFLRVGWNSLVGTGDSGGSQGGGGEHAAR